MGGGPYVQESEQTVVGALAVFREARERHLDRLSADDFESEACRTVFLATKELVDRGFEVELVTLTRHLRDTDQLERVGGPPFINDLLESVGTCAGMDGHVVAVKEAATRRRIREQAVRLAQEAENMGEHDLGDIRARVNAVGACLVDSGEPDGQTIEQMAEDGDIEAEVTHTGFAPLDERLNPSVGGGFVYGQCGIASGRTSAGKTTLCCNIALCYSKRVGPALYLSTEDPDAELRRYILRQAYRRAAGSQLRRLTEADWRRDGLAVAKDFVRGVPLHIRNVSGRAVSAVIETAVQFNRKKGVRLVVIDRLECLTYCSGATEAEQISNSIKSLSDMAVKSKMVVLLVSQPKNIDESRLDGLLRMEDLKGSSALSQFARFILLLHNPAEEAKQAAIRLAEACNRQTGAAVDKTMARIDQLGRKAVDSIGKLRLGIEKQKHGPAKDWGSEQDIMTWEPEWYYLGPPEVKP